MKPLELHELAMHHSFLAKQARNLQQEDRALENYTLAAELETQAAEYYIDKPEMEPTRSILIRSAAFLNLKAGMTEYAEKYIFWGIVNAPSEEIRNQLYEALELCLSLKKLDRTVISGSVDYIYKLRQRSLHYSIEPPDQVYGSAVTLDMVSEFAENYTKSFEAFSKSEFRDFFSSEYEDKEKQETDATAFSDLMKPLITSAAFGSFKFSIACDFLQRYGESEKFALLKSNVLTQYHNNVFIKEYSDSNIEYFKSHFSSDEINDIFRPLFNIKSKRAPYKVAYYDRESLKKVYLPVARNREKKKLLPKRTPEKEEIGFLESIITHNRGSKKNVILKQKMKSSAFDYPTNLIEPKGYQSIILTEEILINVEFNSESGFTLSFEELDLEVTDVIFLEALNKFYIEFLELVITLNLKSERNDVEIGQWAIIKRLIGNPEGIK